MNNLQVRLRRRLRIGYMEPQMYAIKWRLCWRYESLVYFYISRSNSDGTMTNVGEFFSNDLHAESEGVRVNG